MSLGKREKELVAVGISVAAGCKPCTDYHLKAVRETGATYDEIRDAIQLGAAVRKRAADVMEDYALKRDTTDDAQGMPPARLDLLISIGAAYAVNSTDELERYRTAARKANVAELDVKSVGTLAQFIRGKAISESRTPLCSPPLDRRASRASATTQGNPPVLPASLRDLTLPALSDVRRPACPTFHRVGAQDELPPSPQILRSGRLLPFWLGGLELRLRARVPV
jgi:AhpD family alkylhydroperoxidase